jgi:hypothetical protein
MTQEELFNQLQGMVEYQKEEALPYVPTEDEPADELDADDIGKWWYLCAEFLDFTSRQPELLAQFLATKEGNK